MGTGLGDAVVACRRAAPGMALCTTCLLILDAACRTKELEEKLRAETSAREQAEQQLALAHSQLADSRALMDSTQVLRGAPHAAAPGACCFVSYLSVDASTGERQERGAADEARPACHPSCRLLRASLPPSLHLRRRAPCTASCPSGRRWLMTRSSAWRSRWACSLADVVLMSC